MLPSYHLIIVDDDEAVRAMLARAIARIYPSVTISTVPDGADALMLYGQRGADLILTNHDMPVISGLELIRALRASKVSVPIVMLSGDTTVEAQALALDANAFLAKPVRFAQLRAVLTRLLPP